MTPYDLIREQTELLNQLRIEAWKKNRDVEIELYYSGGLRALWELEQKMKEAGI